MFEPSKTPRALDRVATGTGCFAMLQEFWLSATNRSQADVSREYMLNTLVTG
jgi:hypothetical protein